MLVGQPIKAHVIDQSPNKSIVMSYYIIAAVNHYQLTDLIAFHNRNDRLRLANRNPNTTASLASRIFEM